jgi:hypothetical protein
MDQDTIEPATADAAFQELCAEVSLLRRAVAALTAERQAQPDYGPSLQAIEAQYQRVAQWAKRVAETPVLKLTPEYLEQEIVRIAADVRRQDRETIEAANSAMATAVGWMRQIVESAVSAEEQFRRLCLTGGVALLIGMFLSLAIIEVGRAPADRGGAVVQSVPSTIRHPASGDRSLADNAPRETRSLSTENHP